MGNLVKISTKTAGSGGTANFQFSGISAAYQDIFIVMTARSNRANAIDAIKVYFNTDTTAGNYRLFRLFNSTSTVTLQTMSTYADEFAYIAGNNATASDFSSTYLYVGNYSGTTLPKSMNMRSGGADNSSTNARTSFGSMYWSGTAAINQITIAPNTGTLFQEFSSATLYGILPQSVGGTGSKATGGTVTTAGGYTYHAFTATGSLIPSTNITGAEVLIVAGGGGSGGVHGASIWAAGGGGAGGLIYASSVSLTSGIKYPAIVGAGGIGGYGGGQPGKNGYNSSFGNQTIALGGGGGGGYEGGGATVYAAQVGGSGGGAQSGQNYNATASGAAGTAGQGNAGGSGYYNPNMTGGGGGGAGAVGGNATTTTAGSGGAGLSTYSAWGAATSTGQNISGTYWYAGGGGGSSGGSIFSSPNGGAGGNGGGGFGANQYDGKGSAGLPYTGGGGGAQPSPNQFGSGGSGVVIIRYTT